MAYAEGKTRAAAAIDCDENTAPAASATAVAVGHEGRENIEAGEAAAPKVVKKNEGEALRSQNNTKDQTNEEDDEERRKKGKEDKEQKKNQ